MNPCRTFADVLELQAEYSSQQTAYTFLGDGEQESGRLTYSDLLRRSRRVASWFSQQRLAGERVVLVFPDGLDFVVAFLASLMAGVVAVPSERPRPRRPDERLRAIVMDCRPAAILTVAAMQADLRERSVAEAWSSVSCVASIQEAEAAGDGDWLHRPQNAEDLAFLQYTSGSTGMPKGVMVTQGNLMANSRVIKEALGHEAGMVGVCWLPMFHDMGLIGHLLQPLFVGYTMVLMPPVSAVQRPIRWLKAITRYRAHTSGGPNFMYDLCVHSIPDALCQDLDLSSWRVAYSGAEPVRAGTLKAFGARFSRHGFSPQAWYPCYGMAEATLMVSCASKERGEHILDLDPETLEQGMARPAGDGTGGRRVVSCGQVQPEHQIAVVDPTTCHTCGSGCVGEIWVRGPSVAKGYWGQSALSADIFQATRADWGDGPWLRTGDLGFLLAGEIYITGRCKDLIIVRGRNHFPQDIEATIESCHPALRANGTAAFSVDVLDQEQLVAVIEVNRRDERSLDRERIDAAVRQAVNAGHGLLVHDLVLIRQGSLPRTSSGKVRRDACRTQYRAGLLERLVVTGTNGTLAVQASG